MHGKGILTRRGESVEVEWERGKLIRPVPP